MSVCVRRIKPNRKSNSYAFVNFIRSWTCIFSIRCSCDWGYTSSKTYDDGCPLFRSDSFLYWLLVLSFFPSWFPLSLSLSLSLSLYLSIFLSLSVCVCVCVCVSRGVIEFIVLLASEPTGGQFQRVMMERLLTIDRSIERLFWEKHQKHE